MNPLLRKLMGMVLQEEAESAPSSGGATTQEINSTSSTSESTPSETAAAEAGDTAGEQASSVDWDDLLTESEDADEGEEESSAPAAAAPAATEAAQGQPAAQPAAGTEGTQPAAAQPAASAAPAAQSAAEQPPAQPVAAAPAKTREQLEAEAKQARADYEGKAEGYFKNYLTPELAAQLQTEPEVVLPKLMAKMFVDVEARVISQVGALLPHVISRTQETQTVEHSARNEFLTAWPELKDYEEQVKIIGTTFRQANPKATKEQAIKAIGEMTMAALQLTRAQPAAGAPASGSKQNPPQGRFRPASPGAAAGGPATPASTGDGYMDMAHELLHHHS